ncbi:hypothetical protein RND81_02G007300 [Saponaria officinalis]|uniref:Cytochrome P450 n=1 Tax=Saponaria officinalis TaxID=3572 RepID=A0AAW1MPQ5_SAPOF
MLVLILKLLPLFLPLFILPLLIILFFNKICSVAVFKNLNASLTKTLKSNPLISQIIALRQHKEVKFQWLSNLLVSSPSSTFITRRPFGGKIVFTANPAIVEHILRTRFTIYEKGPNHKNSFRDVFGDGMFTTNGDAWKVQRNIASHGFSSKYLHRFVDNFLDFELTERLIPLLSEATKNNKVYDFQDILKKFAFDNICMTSFGYDPAYLSPSSQNDKFSEAFDEAVMISEMRYRALHPIIWKICRFFNIGYEKKLKEDIKVMQNFATSVVKPLKQRIIDSPTSEENKLKNVLERLLKHNPNLSDKYLVDMVNSAILAGRDTTSAALTWFFWVLHKNKRAEDEIVNEIRQKKVKAADVDHHHSHDSAVEEIKDMVYTHAALCESMRLYPPIAINFREATTDDVLPDGTRVTKGTTVAYVPYAMGRMEKLWGPDWAEYRPERWLREEVDPSTGEKRWRFVPRDPYSFPVFHAGPRICLGKDMAFMQMKRVVTGVLERFRVVPAVEDGFEPVYLVSLTAIMQGGFPVRFEKRI